MVLMPVVRLNLEKPRSALALINLKFFGSILLDLRPNVEIRWPFLKGVKFFSKNVLLREGTQLGVDAMRPWLRSVIQASKLACATLTCTLLRRPHGSLPASSLSLADAFSLKTRAGLDYKLILFH